MLLNIPKSMKSKTLKMLSLMFVILIVAGCASSRKGGTKGGKDKVITNISSSVEASGAVRITVEGSSNLTYTSLQQLLPLSIVLYFPGTRLKDVNDEYSGAGGIVSSIKTSQQDYEAGADARIKILLNQEVDYEVSKKMNGLEIVVTSLGGPLVDTKASGDTQDSDELGAMDGIGEEPLLDDMGGMGIDESSDEFFGDAIGDDEIEIVDDDTELLDDSFDADTDVDADDTIDDSFEPLSSGGTATRVLHISRKIGGDDVEITIEGDGKIENYDVFSIPKKDGKAPRIVCDIMGVKGIKTRGEKVIRVNANGVEKIRYFTYPNKMRIVIDMDWSNAPDFDHKPINSGLRITVKSKGDGTGSLSDESEIELAELQEPEKKEGIATKLKDLFTDDEEEDEEAFEPIASGGSAAHVNRIDFLTGKDGKTSILIGTTGPVAYREKKKDDKTIHVRLMNVVLPRSRRYPFITTRFDSAVNRILPVQTSGMKKNALFIIELRESVPFSISQENGLLSVNIEPSSIGPVPENKAGLPEWQRVLSQTKEIAEIEKEAAGKATSVYVPPKGSGDMQGSDDEEFSEPETAYIPPETSEDDISFSGGDDNEVDSSEEITGDPGGDAWGGEDFPSGPGALDDFDGLTDDQLAEGPVERQEPKETEREGRVETASSNSDSEAADSGYVSWGRKKKYIGEKISVDFYDTDIKNIMRIIREISGENFAVDKDVSGKATMILDNPVPWDQVLDLVLRMNMLGMVSDGGINRIATLETLRMEEEKRLEFIAAEEKTKLKKKALEPLITKYIFINYTDVESGVKPVVQEMLTPDRGKVIVDTRTNQLIVTDTEKKVEEILALIKQIDKMTSQVIIEARIVEASTSFARNLGSQWGVQSNPTADPYSDVIGGTYGYNVAINNAVASNYSFGFNFTRLVGANFLLNATLYAMENKGEGKIISAPKIITMDNKKAEIQQGQSYPYRVVEDGAAKTKFVDIVLKLSVTPHVTADKKISLEIKIDKDDISEMTGDGPAIAKNNISTELLIDDGDTIVIGGVVKSTKQKAVQKLPILSNLPFVGWLFRNKTESETKSELLIFLTPRVATFVGER